MSGMLKNERGRFLQSYELMPLLGFKRGAHLPLAGFGPTEVQGTNFLCRPAKPGERKHRLLFECKCLRWVPFGRANQHKCRT